MPADGHLFDVNGSRVIVGHSPGAVWVMAAVMPMRFTCDQSDEFALLFAAARGLAGHGCVCGPDETGENPDCRSGCPVHGASAPYDLGTSDIGEAPF